MVKQAEANALELEAALGSAVRAFYDPETGGDPAAAVEGDASEPGEGWPFGRSVFLSELYELLERVPGVDHVDGIVSPAATLPISGHQLPELGDVTVEVV